MIGDVLVSVVLFESDGSIDVNQENWTSNSIDDVKDTVIEGLQWWEDLFDAQGTVHDLNFQLDFTYADSPVPTGYEPIVRSSNDYALWVDDFLTYTGFQTSGGISEDIRAFNNAQRVTHNTNWAFTIFVANANNDFDGSFGFGGFSQAFAFSGGRFFVMPSGRPASTVAHETAHMFYAFDEYSGGKSYYDTRGYYNTRNLNGYEDHPNPGDRVLSLMDNNLEVAYAQDAVSTSALEMIGWRDSDNNGIFDVLDVPNQLTGSGRYDAGSGVYHFEGHARVGTLPNLNPSGLGNDITLNEISRIQYRVDGGSWQDAFQVHLYETDLDFDLPLTPGWSTLEIRAIDDTTGISSPIFMGLPNQATTTQAGVRGFLYLDENPNQTWETQESPLANWMVEVLDDQGSPIAQRGVEPDDHASGTTLNNIVPGVTLTSVGPDVIQNTVAARPRETASTGAQVFTHLLAEGWSGAWTSSGRNLRMDFTSPVSWVSLDAVANSDFDYGRLEIYDSNDNLLARYTTGPLGYGQVETMTLTRPTADIAYAIAKGHAGTAVLFDNLHFDPPRSVTTDGFGTFSFEGLPEGDYQLRFSPPPGYEFDGTDTFPVTYTSGSIVELPVNGTLIYTGWHNIEFPEDVDASGSVTTIDALLVINELLLSGPGPLPDNGNEQGNRFLDADGNRELSVIDALLVINYLLSQSPSQAPVEAAPASGGKSLVTSEDTDSGGEQPVLEAEFSSTTLVSTTDSGEGEPDELGWSAILVQSQAGSVVPSAATAEDEMPEAEPTFLTVAANTDFASSSTNKVPKSTTSASDTPQPAAIDALLALAEEDDPLAITWRLL